MGNDLFEQVTALTGLPQEMISKELIEVLDRNGTCPNQVTIDELRKAMMSYLHEVFLSESDSENQA